jgi:HrpA-like RNA helicase
MSLPTLLLKGNLEETEWSPKKDELDKHIPLDYIMQFFEDRVGGAYGESAKIKPKSVADRIMILKSSTGSGKSTTLPPELYHRFQERTRKNIYCSQPRVLTAIDIPKNSIPPFQTKEALIKAGYPNREPIVYKKNIGTQTGVFTARPIKGIIYGTPGVLTGQFNNMTNEDFMAKYSFIIVDEAHERSIEIDTLLFIMKKFIEANYMNKECPFLIIMSATFDTVKFCDYLLSSVPAPERYLNIISVSGMTYPIEERFLKSDSQNYMETIVEKVIEIHTENTMDFMPPSEVMKNKKIYKLDEDVGEDKLIKAQKFRDILIFVGGAPEIKKLKKKISDLNSKHEFFQKYPVMCLGLTSDAVTSQSPEYRNAIERSIDELNVEVLDGKKISIKKPVRRVVVSTNVAETGITIETLRYVIDSGMVKSKEFNPTFAVEALIAKGITQSMYKQRRGRVGRKQPGVCYPIYTKTTLEKMQEDQYPDIIKSEITASLLNMIIKQTDPENKVNNFSIHDLYKTDDFKNSLAESKIDVCNLDLLDLPSADSLHYAMEKLYILGAINQNSLPTPIGILMNKFMKMNTEGIRMILAGYAWGAPIIDLITIATFLQHSFDKLFPERQRPKYEDALRMGKFTMFANEQNKVLGYSTLKTNLVVADEFIRYVIVFHELQKRLLEINIKNLDAVVGGEEKRKYRDRNIIEIFNSWAENYGMDAEIMIKIMEVREQTINTLVSNGLNPYQNNDKSYYNIVASYDDNEKYNYIQLLKQCIFEGYKMNIAVWSSTEKKYFSRKNHLSLNIDSDLIMTKHELFKYGDNNPRYIIFDKIDLKLNQSGMYEIKIPHICVLDGYVVVDINFDI